MYDTLMQMGRWFGYRPGVLDLCRLYMPHELRTWFEHMADATEELREEFERMAAQGADPSAFGLRVRSHPVMTVTSGVKMRHGSKILVSFSDTRPESVAFDVTPDAIASNWAALGRLVESLGKPDETNPKRDRPGGTLTYRGYLWKNVGAKEVVAFLRDLKTPATAIVAHGPRVSQYISKLADTGELIEWTVFLRNPNESDRSDMLPHELKVGRSKRLRNPEELRQERRGKLDGDTFSTKVLIDSDYETIDIDLEHYEKALEKKRKADNDNPNPTQPGGYVRSERPPRQGLLLLYNVQPYDPKPRSAPALTEKTIGLVPDLPLVGFAVSFPRSEKSEKIEYVVGNVYLNAEVEQMRQDEDVEEQDAPAS
jgi:hypothetical protein